MFTTTKYEIAAVHSDGRKVLIGYIPWRDLRGVTAMIKGTHGDDGWHIAFTGRNETSFAIEPRKGYQRDLEAAEDRRAAQHEAAQAEIEARAWNAANRD
jgi:hypothetical protein